MINYFNIFVPQTKLSPDHAHCAPQLALQGRINTLRSSQATDRIYENSQFYKRDIKTTKQIFNREKYFTIPSDCFKIWNNPLRRQNWLEFHIILSNSFRPALCDHHIYKMSYIHHHYSNEMFKRSNCFFLPPLPPIRHVT